MALVPNGGPANLAGYVAKYQADTKGKILDIGAGTGLLGVEVFRVHFSIALLAICHRKKYIAKETI